MNKTFFKKWLPDGIAILLFVSISFIYFSPAVPEGRILSQHDTVASIGAGQEAGNYYKETGKRTRWSNAIFGGMPTYQTAPSYPSTNLLHKIEKLYHLYLPEYVWHVFVMLLGFYILLRVMKLSVWLSVLGAIIWAFSSYFFIIIAAGHIWKFITLAYIPPTIAGLILTYRGKYLSGGLLTAFFCALQITSNHVQMSYYFLFVMLFMAIAYGVEACRSKTLPRFLKATGVLIIAALLGVCINASNLYHTYEYSKETMRNKSELVKENSADQTKSGLDRSYITHWSYGIGETFSLLVPNVKGGASVSLATNKTAMAKANSRYKNIYYQLGQYWGEQPGTSGPVYVGAFVFFLFILGLFIVKGPMKWALFAATILSILLSWGKNLMWFTNLFIDYMPMYAKFRTVSSILVIAEFTIPLLAILALKEIIENPQMLKKNGKVLAISWGLSGGLALLFAIFPHFFFPSYVSSSEMEALKGIPASQLKPLLENLEEMRTAVFTADAWRSFLIIAIGMLLLGLYQTKKLKTNTFLSLLIILCLVDMWSINKRYLYDEQFVHKSERKKAYIQTETDKIILKDKTLDYRVLNLATNTYNENNTAYWHKSIGGYHAAKMRRYQEMIDEHIMPEQMQLGADISKVGGDMSSIDKNKYPVLNMLNTRYFILPLQNGNTMPLQNPYALGNAWFVDAIHYVDNANEEIEAIHHIHPAETAVVDRKFSASIQNSPQEGTKRSISLISYEPNKLLYEVDSESGGVVVFSEIYYPSWQVFVDGKKADFGRANYILRAMNVPAGKHQISFLFDPVSLHVTETLAYSALAVLAAIASGLLLWFVLKKRKPAVQTT